MIKPNYIHDCDKCIFLGIYSWDKSNLPFDLYYHPGDAETVIVRFGNEGWMYDSGLSIGKDMFLFGNEKHPLHPLAEAYRRKLIWDKVQEKRKS